MRIFKSAVSTGKKLKSPVAAIGVFDGVHIGHQKILNKMKKEASGFSAENLVITFHIHPEKYLKKTKNPMNITSLEHKISLLEKYGVENCLVIKSDAGFFSMQPIEFIKKFLVDSLKIRSLVVGKDFIFGKSGKGNVDILKTAGLKYNFKVQDVSLISVNKLKVSSSKIRELIQNGDIEESSKLLGRKFSVAGKIKAASFKAKGVNMPLKLIHTQEILPSEGFYNIYIQLDKNIAEGILYSKNTAVLSERKKIYLNLKDKNKIEFFKNKQVEIFFIKTLN